VFKGGKHERKKIKVGGKKTNQDSTRVRKTIAADAEAVSEGTNMGLSMGKKKTPRR